ncbi:hypothetical protein AKJ09_08669 [Labilithrix luteola]|uniref:Uncharacterized protein n=1 Tax=Labilithrix luteola TaxID=1391654 RepID=A0A0K1Q868_9BACT|nr:hypothetical protein AKJ09_08669 [Labilithrix luteola]
MIDVSAVGSGGADTAGGGNELGALGGLLSHRVCGITVPEGGRGTGTNVFGGVANHVS